MKKIIAILFSIVLFSCVNEKNMITKHAIEMKIAQIDFSDSALKVKVRIANKDSFPIWVLSDFEDRQLLSPFCVYYDNNVLITPSLRASEMLIHPGKHSGKFLLVKPDTEKDLWFSLPLENEKENSCVVRCGPPMCVKVEMLRKIVVKTVYIKNLPADKDCLLRGDHVIVKSEEMAEIPASCGGESFMLEDEREMK
ncbi:MAG TPA: hypothetical protein PLV42_09495 [bacterium]|nr:hypothetical protein [bacterium]